MVGAFLESEKKMVTMKKSHDKEVKQVFDHYVTVMKKNKLTKLNPARRKMIKNAIKFHGLDVVLLAITNMSKDTWPDRAKYSDIRYAIGTVRGIDNCEKWACMEPENPTENKVDFDSNIAHFLRGDK